MLHSKSRVLVIFITLLTISNVVMSEVDIREAAKKRNMKEKVRKILVILGNTTEFGRAVLWLSGNLSFDVDARINLFECNIRVLGGLVSAHILATDSRNRLAPGAYDNQLLNLAEDLGQRFLHAFDTPTGLPYAWINLKYGVMKDETTETSTSGCGSLILEMGALSRLTGDSRYEAAALRALRKLWSMRSPLNLVGTTLDVVTGEWIEYSSGIGAGVDSFYEYLMKAYILFGREEFWDMFHPAYIAVQKYFRHGPCQITGCTSARGDKYQQERPACENMLVWQVLVGDVAAANASHREFFSVWEKFGVLPERFINTHLCIIDPWYLKVGESIVNSLNRYTKVEGGYASIKDVATMKLEDHQHSFFLAETCKYLYLLFDDSFLLDQNYVFTTEGHPLPVKCAWHERLPDAYIPTNWTSFMASKYGTRRASAMSLQVCPSTTLTSEGFYSHLVESACHIPDLHVDHRCITGEDCGIDSTSCKRRTCSMAGYCGLWLFTT
ncbi:hypothetical protein IFM89_000848 [Coptis chinensis]|uniref:alpha-1,2-Mannosidase n=1 Tax=Coptis chinensis TaxID=261450 RepID=A0A835ITI2_9MAGN|nr:hypothetical protein IFM89_000848 [Coptis chinensis]